ncbi:hypothetical protein GNI_004030 [Gregarina niphandrodes]|uniref:Uncharacterized protein n=1 Tax=Gregarina niphandrodes TaxID=110365 RepID=A0A023BDP5_GRENI|nr:hypothetical protein GNI_004030 [Gregarina niphandrodes]EZG88607.1 hypothetical protein GNI_004030 [Gregarina niphandrodes]|eukprot:XP_011128542.1 hypothetical protein GNI_004030 [Gregarina niphandrodes]
MDDRDVDCPKSTGEIARFLFFSKAAKLRPELLGSDTQLLQNVHLEGSIFYISSGWQQYQGIVKERPCVGISWDPDVSQYAQGTGESDKCEIQVSAANSTAANSTAANGTAANGTAANGTGANGTAVHSSIQGYSPGCSIPNRCQIILRGTRTSGMNDEGVELFVPVYQDVSFIPIEHIRSWSYGLSLVTLAINSYCEELGRKHLYRSSDIAQMLSRRTAVSFCDTLLSKIWPDDCSERGTPGEIRAKEETLLYLGASFEKDTEILSGYVTCVDISRNRGVFDWSEIMELKRAFPKLESLDLSGCTGLFHTFSRPLENNANVSWLRSIKLRDLHDPPDAPPSGRTRHICALIHRLGDVVDILDLAGSVQNEQELAAIFSEARPCTSEPSQSTFQIKSLRLRLKKLTLPLLASLPAEVHGLVLEQGQLMFSGGGPPMRLEEVTARDSFLNWYELLELSSCASQVRSLKIAYPKTSFKGDVNPTQTVRHIAVSIFPLLKDLNGTKIHSGVATGRVGTDTREEAELYTISLYQRGLLFDVLGKAGVPSRYTTKLIDCSQRIPPNGQLNSLTADDVTEDGLLLIMSWLEKLFKTHQVNFDPELLLNPSPPEELVPTTVRPTIRLTPAGEVHRLKNPVELSSFELSSFQIFPDVTTVLMLKYRIALQLSRRLDTPVTMGQVTLLYKVRPNAFCSTNTPGTLCNLAVNNQRNKLDAHQTDGLLEKKDTEEDGAEEDGAEEDGAEEEDTEEERRLVRLENRLGIKHEKTDEVVMGPNWAFVDSVLRLDREEKECRITVQLAR